MTMPSRRAVGPRTSCRVLAVSTGLALALTFACHRPRSPEDQVRDAIAALAQAVEDKNTKTIRGLVSDRYKDAEEHDRAEALATLQMLFRRHPRIHLLTRVTTVDIPAPGEARATVVVAMASTPIKVLEDLRRLQADINRFDLTLVEATPKNWQVTGAAWQTARPEDLF